MKIPLRLPYWPLAVVPFALSALGWGLNIAAISANHGLMPVLNVPWLGMDNPDEFHRLLLSGDHLKFLTDVIIFPHRGALSLGDVCMKVADWCQLPALAAWVTLIARDYFEV